MTLPIRRRFYRLVFALLLSSTNKQNFASSQVETSVDGTSLPDGIEIIESSLSDVDNVPPLHPDDDASSSSSFSVDSSRDDDDDEDGEDDESINKPTEQRLFGGFQSNETNNSSTHTKDDSSIPFVKHSTPLPTPIPNVQIPPDISENADHPPPEGFKITAHVVSSSSDGLSYFAPHPPSHIPFYECDSVGLTTPPVPLRHLTFRHLRPQKASPGWGHAGGEGSAASAAQLIVCLHPLQITVSGDVDNPRQFEAGDVILMEDGVGKGHQIAAINDGEKDLSVLVLTLHRGLMVNGGQKPCPNPHYGTLSSNSMVRVESLTARRALLAGVGMGLSSFLTYFLGKVAPHVLAVGVGGLCVMVGGTCAVVKMGEGILDDVTRWRDQQRMEKLDRERNTE